MGYEILKIFEGRTHIPYFTAVLYLRSGSELSRPVLANRISAHRFYKVSYTEFTVFIVVLAKTRLGDDHIYNLSLLVRI